MRGGVVEIVTTKAKPSQNARSLSPIAERGKPTEMGRCQSPSAIIRTQAAKFELPSKNKNFCFGGNKTRPLPPARPQVALVPVKIVTTTTTTTTAVPIKHVSAKPRKKPVPRFVIEVTENAEDETAPKKPASPLQRKYLMNQAESITNPLDSPLETPGRDVEISSQPQILLETPIQNAINKGSVLSNQSELARKNYGTAQPTTKVLIEEETPTQTGIADANNAKRPRRRRDDRKKAKPSTISGKTKSIAPNNIAASNNRGGRRYEAEFECGTDKRSAECLGAN
jgi:hypothetical protein